MHASASSAHENSRPGNRVAAATSPAAKKKNAHRRAAAAVFVVEDDPQIASLIQAFLTRLGYVVSGSAQAGDDALVAIERNRPDLVLMDIALSGELDGVQTAAVVAARFEIPVVFLTGLADETTLHRSQESGAFGYLLKPFEQEDLKAAIDLALAKHQMESRLRHVDRWFAAAIRSITDGIIATDQCDRVTFLNPVAERLTGHCGTHALGRPLSGILELAEEIHGDEKGLSAQADHAGSAGVHFEATLIPSDGIALPIECSAAPLRNAEGATIGRIIVFRDVSTRRQSEFELQQSHEQLRALAGHLQAAREAERMHIAREIHDQFGQLLTGLRLDLAWLQQHRPAASSGNAHSSLDAESTQKLNSALALVDAMVSQVRRIAGELRPGVLDDLGLVAALEWQAREWQERTKIPCRFTTSHDPVALPSEPRTALFRIFQEALTNITRHARASQVEATLTCADGTVQLAITDNGHGFTAPAQGTQSLGLLGMRERAAMAGGTLSVQNNPSGGTTVLAQVPLALKDAA